MIRVLGFVVVLAGLGLGLLVLMPADRIAMVAAERLGQSLGRAVTLTGVVRPTLWPHLGVRAEGISVANPDWASEGPLITADALVIRVPWAAIVSDAPQIDEITLLAPDIMLVRAADGRTSWSMPVTGGASDRTGAGDHLSSFGVTAARIIDGSLRFVDHATPQTLRMTALELELGLSVSGQVSIIGQGRVNGAQVELMIEAADMTQLSEGGLSDVALSLGWSGGTGRFDGQISLAPALEGQVSLDATDLSPLFSLMGVTMPDLPPGLGRDRVALSGQVTLASEGSAHLRSGRLVLNQTEVALDLDLLPGDARPMIRGTVSGSRLSVPQQPSAPSGGGWSTTPIDVSGLFAVDAELAVALGRVDGAGVTLGPLDLRAALTRGRLVLDIDRIGVHGGTLAGQFVLNGRNGLSVGGDLRLREAALSPLLAELAGFDRLETTGGARLQFLGVGNDMATLMRSLSGDGSLALGTGALRGLDLAGMIRTLDLSHQGAGAQTVFDGVTAGFTIADGVLSNADLVLDAPWGQVMGQGRVDLGAQQLNYRLTPRVSTGGDGSTIRVPILVSGPWSAPVIRPDLAYLAEQELAVERAKLEAEAQARLDAERARLETEARARANALLGTDLGPDSTLDDARGAVEQRLREEAEQQLLRLLGRGN